MNDGAHHEIARARLLSVDHEPLLLSDWERALFMHFEVEPRALQTAVPFKLDLREGRAYVSLVAFTMRRLRPCLGGRLTGWCFKPMATHELLNLRTYVHHRGEPGIFFLAEWIPNRLSAFLGPRTFGLPYRLGRLQYEHDHERGNLRGDVEDMRRSGQAAARLKYTAAIECDRQDASRDRVDGDVFRPCVSRSLDEFLVERYTAFTQYGSKARFFRVWHTPWPQVPARVSLLDDSLLRTALPCFKSAKLVGANYSPGVTNVWMGRPHQIERFENRNTVLSSFFEMP
jgi:uncharacterized protein YqjF (DUF2071 family)